MKKFSAQPVGPQTLAQSLYELFVNEAFMSYFNERVFGIVELVGFSMDQRFERQYSSYPEYCPATIYMGVDATWEIHYKARAHSGKGYFKDDHEVREFVLEFLDKLSSE